MGAHDPREVLPHRPPFLFVDEILEYDPKGLVRAVRTFRADEPFFAGHFPGNPIVPGVLLLEGMAQTVGYLAMQRARANRAYLVGIDQARFRRPVLPGDRVEFTVTLEHERLSIMTAHAEARVDGKKVADATLRGKAYRVEEGDEPMQPSLSAHPTGSQEEEI